MNSELKIHQSRFVPDKVGIPLHSEIDPIGGTDLNLGVFRDTHGKDGKELGREKGTLRTVETDRHSLTMTLYYLLGGDTPSFIPTGSEAKGKYEAHNAYVLRDLPPEIPSEAITVLRKATNLDRTQRYDNKTQMMKALRQAIIAE